MLIRSMVVAALAAVVLPAAALAAAAPSQFAAPDPGAAVALSSSALDGAAVADVSRGPEVLALTPADGARQAIESSFPTTLEAVHYRPRRYRPSNGYWMPIVSQVHAGFYDPNGDEGAGFMGGFRFGPMVDPHVQLGLGLDWEHKESQLASVIGTSTIPGVGSGTISDERSRTSVDFVPLMAFVQVSGDENMAIIPYGGIGGGWQWMTVSADLADGTTFDGTYGGWGWQVWGGAAVPLSGRARLTGEAFYNGVDVARDFTDDQGRTLRETVNRDGFGLRFGVGWGF